MRNMARTVRLPQGGAPRQPYGPSDGCGQERFLKISRKWRTNWANLGPLQYVRHEGSRPMSITWRMEHPMPARVVRWSRGAA